MNYHHKYFSLNTESRKIFDENNKEVLLTGNSYRVLEFLCEKKNATLTDIGEYLDRAKDYDENHLRQYRYKINLLIGHEVVEYKNGIYSLKGSLTERNTERNTDLLHSPVLKSENMNQKLSLYKWPAIVASIVLALAVFISWPYGYYSFLRLVVIATAIYYAYQLYIAKIQNFWFWALIGVAILFNPIFPVFLYSKAIWGVIDLAVIAFLTLLISKVPKLKHE